MIVYIMFMLQGLLQELLLNCDGLYIMLMLQGLLQELLLNWQSVHYVYVTWVASGAVVELTVCTLCLCYRGCFRSCCWTDSLYIMFMLHGLLQELLLNWRSVHYVYVTGVASGAVVELTVCTLCLCYRVCFRSCCWTDGLYSMFMLQGLLQELLLNWRSVHYVYVTGVASGAVVELWRSVHYVYVTGFASGAVVELTVCTLCLCYRVCFRSCCWTDGLYIMFMLQGFLQELLLNWRSVHYVYVTGFASGAVVELTVCTLCLCYRVCFRSCCWTDGLYIMFMLQGLLQELLLNWRSVHYVYVTGVASGAVVELTVCTLCLCYRGCFRSCCWTDGLYIMFMLQGLLQELLLNWRSVHYVYVTGVASGTVVELTVCTLCLCYRGCFRSCCWTDSLYIMFMLQGLLQELLLNWRSVHYVYVTGFASGAVVELTVCTLCLCYRGCFRSCCWTVTVCTLCLCYRVCFRSCCWTDGLYIMFMLQGLLQELLLNWRSVHYVYVTGFASGAVVELTVCTLCLCYRGCFRSCCWTDGLYIMFMLQGLLQELLLNWRSVHYVYVTGFASGAVVELTICTLCLCYRGCFRSCCWTDGLVIMFMLQGLLQELLLNWRSVHYVYVTGFASGAVVELTVCTLCLCYRVCFRSCCWTDGLYIMFMLQGLLQELLLNWRSVHYVYVTGFASGAVVELTVCTLCLCYRGCFRSCCWTDGLYIMFMLQGLLQELLLNWRSVHYVYVTGFASGAVVELTVCTLCLCYRVCFRSCCWTDGLYIMFMLQGLLQELLLNWRSVHYVYVTGVASGAVVELTVWSLCLCYRVYFRSCCWTDGLYIMFMLQGLLQELLLNWQSVHYVYVTGFASGAVVELWRSVHYVYVTGFASGAVVELTVYTLCLCYRGCFRSCCWTVTVCTLCLCYRVYFRSCCWTVTVSSRWRLSRQLHITNTGSSSVRKLYITWRPLLPNSWPFTNDSLRKVLQSCSKHLADFPGCSLIKLLP